MPSIIPKAYYCPACKKEIGKKTCDCGAKTKPVPPYSVRFRWIGDNGLEVQKKLSDKSWTTQSAAQRGYEKWIAEHPTNKKSSLLNVDFLSLYEEYKHNLKANVKEPSYMTFVQRFETHVLPYFKDKKVTEITAVDISKWQTGLTEQGFSVKYRTSIRGVLNHFYSYLKIYGIANPVALVPGFKKANEAKKEMDFWTQQEFEQFIRVVDNPTYKALFAFLYLTGCRKGEALALRWADVDLKVGSVKINKTLTQKTVDGSYRSIPPKTSNSYRTILLPSSLIDLLNEYKDDIKPNQEDYVFGGKTYIPFNSLTNYFKRYIKLSGVKMIRVHDLRHSHASLLINSGDNQLQIIYVIANRLGDTVEMIFKTYGHLFPNAQKDIVDKLNVPL